MAETDVILLFAGPCITVGSASDSRARGPGFDTQSGHMLSLLDKECAGSTG